MYKCYKCGLTITFMNRVAYDGNGIHKCKGKNSQVTKDPEPAPQAVLFAMAAMNALIQAQIQHGGIDHMHRMNCHDIADLSWQMAAAMIKGEENYRFELTGD